MFYWERGAHLEESSHLGVRIICGSFLYFRNVEITIVAMVVAAMVTVRLEGSVSCWCQ